MPDFLGVDVGGTRVKLGVVTLPTGTMHGTTAFSTPTSGVDALVDQIYAAAHDLTGVRDLARVGIGVPGRVDGDTVGEVWDTLAYLTGTAFPSLVRRRFGVATVVDNDARVAAAGEAAFGGHQHAARLLSVTLGTGIGVALAESGRPASAVGHLAGHIPIREAGRRCFCGQTDCLEALVATGAGAADTDPTSDTYLDDLARGLVALIHVFAPDQVVIGGGVSRALGPVLPALQDRVHAGLTRVAAPAIHLSRLMEAAGVLGSAIVAAQRIPVEQI